MIHVRESSRIDQKRPQLALQAIGFRGRELAQVLRIAADGERRLEMDEVLARLWENLGGRIGGPLTLRLILQPVIAAALAVRAGLGDARAGRPAYFWTILTNPDHRRDLLREGWKAVAKIFTMAVIIDVVYQVMVFRWVYPAEVVIVAFLLACVPYLLIRGASNVMAAAGRH